MAKAQRITIPLSTSVFHSSSLTPLPSSDSVVIYARRAALRGASQACFVQRTIASSATCCGSSDGPSDVSEEEAKPSSDSPLIVQLHSATRPGPTIDRMIRVNQAGEFGANRIYAGQAAILGDTETGPLIQVLLQVAGVQLHSCPL